MKITIDIFLSYKLKIKSKKKLEQYIEYCIILKQVKIFIFLIVFTCFSIMLKYK